MEVCKLGYNPGPPYEITKSVQKESRFTNLIDCCDYVIDVVIFVAKGIINTIADCKWSWDHFPEKYTVKVLWDIKVTEERSFDETILRDVERIVFSGTPITLQALRVNEVVREYRDVPAKGLSFTIVEHIKSRGRTIVDLEYETGEASGT